MIHVLDAGPMIVSLNGEPGRATVEQILIDNSGECHAHFMNLSEVYYTYLRRGGVKAAETALQTLAGVGVLPCCDSDEAFWKEAATFKAWHPMSLPDAYCLALAKRLGGTLITTDRKEFGPVQTLAIAPIRFIP